MESFFNNLGIPGEDLLVNKDCVFTGDNYRISILTERLVRLEYSENGVFYDNATEQVHFRNMPKPEFTQTESFSEDSIHLPATNPKGGNQNGSICKMS